LKIVCADLAIVLKNPEFSAGESKEFEGLKEKFNVASFINSQSKSMARNYLSTLNDELNRIYHVLFQSSYPWLYADPLNVLSNYKPFSTVNKDLMWPDLIKLELFHKNREIFDRINSIYSTLVRLNQMMSVLIPSRFTLSADAGDVHNYRDLMNEIKNLYVSPRNGNIRYEESPIGEFLSNAVKSLV
jgi:hypothetical protein